MALITALGLLCNGGWRLDAAPAGTIHYPDLQVVVPLDSFSIEPTSPTTREFRYTHDQANLGDGPFELRLDYDPVNDLARAFQRIYTHDASTLWSILSETLVVGRFLYHPAHGHYHVPFANFGLFRIAADGSVGAPVAKSDKVGFCIADSVLIAAIPHAGVFGYSGDHCADPRSILGISVGWGDLYDFHDAGQSIIYEPATIPDGEYWFRAVADPFNYFIEKNEANNITDIRLRITGTAVTVVAGPFHPDSTPPAVSLTAPTAGAVSGTAVTISANASHASGISSVQFLLDGNPLGPPDTAPPYTLLWNTTTVADGSHDVSAQALTPTGLYGTSIPVIVTVANNGPPPPPTPSPVTISNVFVSNRTSSSANVTWTTNVLTTSEVSYGLDSNYGLFASDVSFGTNHSIPLTGLTPTTTYHYRVTSRDAVGNFATAGDFIFTTPAVSDITCNLTAPIGGTIVSGIITVAADAFGTASVRGVQFLLDGAPLGAEVTLEPFAVAWDTRSALNGSHVLSAVARDPTNNQATCAPVPVIVSNSGPSTVGLVAAFGFDENQGAVAADRTANANNGSISGATWTSSGRFGSALVFDGSNDIVTVNDANTLDLTNALTLEAWVYPTTLSGWRTALLKERPGGLAYALYAHDNLPRPAGYVNVGGSDRAAVGTTALPLNAWSHIATTYDGATLRLFVNAVQVGSTAVTGSAAVSGNQLSIGGNTAWGEYFAGRLDEIRIYNRTLAQAEIQIDMNAPVTPVGIQVPSVIGLTQAAATTQITGAGLSVGTVTSSNSTTVPAGSVISQNPTGGTMVAPGSAVNLVISLGPTQASVPSVVGLLQAAAQTAIVNAGLVVGSISSQNSNTAPAGTVIAQSPNAGTLVNAGTPVTLTVSLGPPPPPVPCDPATSNPIVCENAQPGAPSSIWDITGAGDDAIQGFASDISVDQGQTVFFKINTPSTQYRLDIFRMGYYGGMGARQVATVVPSVSLPQSQPNCLSDIPTGLVDCGNWAVSASWTVPTTAVSGIYFAKVQRLDAAGASHIVFIVRDDDGHSDLLFQTSDTTWQAYNRYGGNSLYTGDPAGRAYKVSYNRPFSTRAYAPEDWVFNSEYPMVRWLEANGYSVSYSTGVDTDRRGSELLEHKTFLSVGHDEYWSGAQRTNVEAARAAGIHLAFFSGNEIFWKTRWESSISTGATSYRTLVSYKETHANAKIDPLPNTWTGTWRDPRFSPPADGGRPENALTGTMPMVNDPSTAAIQVPSSKSTLRFWRNTTIASLAPGQVATLPFGTLGYEWDEELDNGFRPPGLIRLSDTTVNGVPILQDYGSTYGPGTANHALTLYRHTSGALVFGAGTIQWSWGLDSHHDRGNDPPSLVMQQATVNLFADMGVQPLTLQAGLFTAVGSADTQGPTSSITSPTNNSAVPANATITITGTATDAGGGVVGGVEVSVNGGATWQRATGREAWTFAWQTGSPATVTLVARAVDDSGNVGVSSQAATVTVGGGTPDTSEAPILVVSSAANPFGTYYAEILRAEGLNAFTAIDISQVTATLLATHDVVILGEVALTTTQVTMFTNWVNNGGNLIAMRPDKKLASLLGLADAGTTLSEGYLLVNTATAPGAGIATDYTWTFTTGSSGTNEWTLCAPEGGVCAFTGTMEVRYGANGSYFYKTLSNGTACTNAVFGDPIFGTAKACAIRSGTPQATDWTFCASEGGSCAFTGTMQVRYGANGSYFYKTLSNGTACTNAVFGDPIAGTAKRCAITSPPPTDWTSCASEGGVCAFTGTMEVRYGANGSYAYKTLSNGTACTNGVFGDPIFGVVKSCSIRTVSVSPPTVRALRPASGASEAAVDDSIAVTFNGTVNPATVTSTTFELRDASNALVPAAITYSAETRTATLTPSTALAANTQYTAHLRGGTGGIADPAGNTLSVGTMQFHGAADRYTLAGASTVATLYGDATTATASPAVTVRSIGTLGGQAAAFTYDLARSVIYTRQGNPAWAGQERDGQAPIRSDDLFFGGGQADWVDLAKVAIPQADEQQRLLANLIQFMNADRKPIPRFWYLPRGLRAVVVMTGDDHGNNGTQGRFDIYQTNSPAGCSVADWQCVRATSYIYPATPIAPAQAAAYVANGFEIAAHITTGCADYTPSSLAATYSIRLGEFAGGFPGLPAPKTNRTHCVPWSDYSSQPTVELANGIRFDTNYYYFPASWVNNTPGMFTGSGMPMRFARFDGTIVDVYQATTQMTDESQQTYPFTINTLLNRALGPEGYYGVFTANMHTDTAVHAGSVAIVASAQARGVPIVSSLQMLQWLDGRNASSFRNLTWSGTTLTFAIDVGAGANGLQALLPLSSGAGPLTRISRGGVPISYTLQTLKGIQYAVFTATAGAYTATYGS